MEILCLTTTTTINTLKLLVSKYTWNVLRSRCNIPYIWISNFYINKTVMRLYGGYIRLVSFCLLYCELISLNAECNDFFSSHFPHASIPVKTELLLSVSPLHIGSLKFLWINNAHLLVSTNLYNWKMVIRLRNHIYISIFLFTSAW